MSELQPCQKQKQRKRQEDPSSSGSQRNNGDVGINACLMKGAERPKTEKYMTHVQQNAPHA